jgi:nucleotide-binding universal stress UspA family protein
MDLRYYQKLFRQVNIGVMSEFKRILVAVDFSLPSITALENAIALCQQLDGTLHIVYVADMADKKNSSAEINGSDTVEMKVFKDFRHNLEELVEKMSNGKTEVLIEVEYGDAADGILQVAVKVSADIIVMGTHGRTGLEHLIVGSVAETVMRKTSIPLMCVRVQNEATD